MKKIYLSIVAAVSLMFVSCTADWLNTDPSTAVPSDDAFKLPRQYTDISGFPYYSGSHALYYRCRNHTGSGAGQDAYGNFVWRCIYGSQHIYWKCTELYGQVIIRRKRYQHAIVLWLHMVVIALSDTCFHHRYDHILFIGGMNYGIL